MKPEKKAPRFPFPRYPRGWFQIAYSDEVTPGQVAPVRYFGQDLVLFRTEAGEVKLLDAHCPHLGAHLGHGGKVVGDVVRCPFHAWEFNGEGKCTAVPYAKRIPNKSDIRTWHVQDVNGLIMAWHDIDGRAPDFEIPRIPEFYSGEWTPYRRERWQLRTHNAEMAENVVDTAHFKYVHGMKIQPQPHEVKADYPTLRMVTKTLMDSPMGEVTGQLEVDALGFGFSTSRFTGMVSTTVIASVTPIDDEFVDVRFSFAVKTDKGADVARGIGRAFTSEIKRQLEEDRPIWENKVFLERPMLCDGDGPFALFRRWCNQFYPQWYIDKAREEYDAAQAGEALAAE
ncbi:MAG: Rieske 2Fe-2S domain-containing protein [Polyangiales bacterium]